jgi:hypothetical protein
MIAVSSEWFFLETGYDNWLYWGAILDPKYRIAIALNSTVSAWDMPYWVSRAGWILPGSIPFALLPPIGAHILLHLTMIYTAAFSLYYAVLKTLTPSAALFCAIFVETYFYSIGAMSWNYPDGAGIVYICLSLAAVTYSVFRPTTMAKICGGASIAACVHAYPLTLMVIPLFCFYYFFLLLSYRKNAVNIADLAKDICKFLFGGLLITLLFGAWFWYLGGYFWFFAGTLAKILSGTALSQTVADKNWILDAHFLVLPVFAFGLALAYFVASKRVALGTPADCFCLMMTILLLIYWAMTIAGKSSLQGAEYVSILIPFSALTLASWLATCNSPKLTMACTAFALFVGFASVQPWWVGPHPWADASRMLWAAILIGVAIAIAVVSFGRALGHVPVVLGLLAYISTFPDYPATMSFTGGRTDKALYSDVRMRTNTYDRFRRTIDLYTFVRRTGEQPTPWLDPTLRDVREIQFGLWGLLALAKWGEPSGNGWHLVQAYPVDAAILVIASDEREGLHRAEEDFRNHALELTPVAKHRLQYGDFGYTLLMCRTSRHAKQN